ncbi:Flagellar motor switch protein FliM [Cystobacter fuscus DSM 2262]|uniref:Flagellar motor switch protein FliM n=1 Tax=Cystobacter fuscus (strain ATCC 25194 / DSM 2262 / NBRC 100088 / M29) TaxID=1242864 RepID=S9P7A0_CYSF2|nr:type III secretion system cytoplasmic ring protein SctQ [Cystobacter fuscus]EPX58082.1 Flagellar motor switch protein FliM [Cystobacter fuscus DSM 2262]
MSLDTDDGPGEERTMVVDARKLKPRSSKPWKPHVFPRLEKVSLTETRLLERLTWLKPGAEAVEALGERFKAIFDTQVGFGLESSRVLGSGELRRVLAEPTFLCFLVPGGHRGRAVLEVELSLAHAAVDLLLGGAGETVGLRPLTDIEEGVASFVVLEAIRALMPGTEPQQGRLRLEGVARGVDEAVSRLSEEAQVAVLQLRARLGTQEGMVRLFLPASVLESLTPEPAPEQRRSLLRMDMEAHLSRLSSVRTWLRAEIGLAEISHHDLASLRVKDVVLVDEFSARPDQGAEGTARLFLGLGRKGFLASEVFVEDGLYQARITEVVLTEPSHLDRRVPSESDEAAAEALSGSDDEASGEGEEYTNPESDNPTAESGEMEDQMDAGDLLGDIPLQICVELARVPVTADDVVSLRAGQVVELHRAPGEPVDLSVNGKVVARGELVEIEGQLGVRILSLAG